MAVLPRTGRLASVIGAVLLLFAVVPPVSGPVQDPFQGEIAPMAWAVILPATDLQPRDRIVLGISATGPTWLYALAANFGRVLDWLMLAYPPVEAQQCLDPTFPGNADCLFNYLIANQGQLLLNRTMALSGEVAFPAGASFITGEVSFYVVNNGSTPTFVRASGTKFGGLVAANSAWPLGTILFLAGIGLNSRQLAQSWRGRRSPRC